MGTHTEPCNRPDVSPSKRKYALCFFTKVLTHTPSKNSDTTTKNEKKGMSRQQQQGSTPPAPAVDNEPFDFDTDGSSAPLSLVDFLIQLSVHGAVSFARRAFLAPSLRVALLLTTEGEQVRQQMWKDGGVGFDGILGCIQHVYKHEGVTGFYRGLFADALCAIPTTLAEELSGDAVGTVVQPVVRDLAATLQSSQMAMIVLSLTATALVSQVASVVTEPVQTVMTCYIADIKTDASPLYKFTGAWDTAKAIYRRNGVRAFYRGVALNMVSAVAYRGTYFLLMHAVFSLISEKAQASYGMLIARILAVVAGCASQPVEVIRRRLMMAAATDKVSLGPVGCTKQILREEGVAGLWSGAKVRSLLTVLGFAVTMAQDFVSASSR